MQIACIMDIHKVVCKSFLVTDFSLVRYIPTGLSEADKNNRPRCGSQGIFCGSGRCGCVTKVYSVWKRGIFTFGGECWVLFCFFSFQMTDMLLSYIYSTAALQTHQAKHTPWRKKKKSLYGTLAVKKL